MFGSMSEFSKWASTMPLRYEIAKFYFSLVNFEYTRRSLKLSCNWTRNVRVWKDLFRRKDLVLGLSNGILHLDFALLLASAAMASARLCCTSLSVPS